MRQFDGTEQFADPTCCVPWEEPRDHECALLGSLKALRVENKRSVACTGLTLPQLLEKALDEVFDDLMAYPDQSDATFFELRGRAQGLAMALAILDRPHYPNMNVIRNEAVERNAERTEVE